MQPETTRAGQIGRGEDGAERLNKQVSNLKQTTTRRRMMLPLRLSATLAVLCGLASGGAPSSSSVGYPGGSVRPDAAVGGSRPLLKGSSTFLAPWSPEARALQKEEKQKLDKGNKNKNKEKENKGAAVAASPPPTPLSENALHGRPVTDNCLRQFTAADEAMRDGGQGWELVRPNCLEWLRANPTFDLPAPALPVTAAAFALPTLYHVSRTSELTTGDDGTRTLEVTYVLGPTDDSFVEIWRPSEPLGDRARLKIDADFDGVPTKVSQIRFRLAETFERARTEAALSGMAFGSGEAAEAELEGATLRLWSITETVFGGWVSEADPAVWDEGSLTWDGLVEGLAGGPKDLLPSKDAGEVLTEFGAVNALEWNEADLTEKVSEMFAASQDDDGDDEWLSLRLSTDGADGVIYGSKDGSHEGPELVLKFVVREAGQTVTAVDDGGSDVVVEDGAETIEGLPVLPDEQDETEEAEIVQAEVASQEEQGVPSTETVTAADDGGSDVAVEEGAEAAEELPVLPDEIDEAEMVQAEVPPQQEEQDVPSTEVANEATESAEEEADEVGEDLVQASTPQSDSTEISQAEIEVADEPSLVDEEQTGWVSPEEVVEEEVVLPEDPGQTEEPADEEEMGWVLPEETVEEENGWVSPAETVDEPQGEVEVVDEPSQADEEQVVLPEGSEEPGQTDEQAAEEASTIAAPIASVVSSSFRMSVTAVRTVRTRNLRSGAVQQARRRLVQSGEEKEAPAIVEHLTEVYAEALTISPSRVSVVFEDDVVQDDLVGDDWEGLSGVVRKGDFRVVGELSSCLLSRLSVGVDPRPGIDRGECPQLTRDRRSFYCRLTLLSFPLPRLIS